MFGKCEWWSVPSAGLHWLDEIHFVCLSVCVCVCAWVSEYVCVSVRVSAHVCSVCTPALNWILKMFCCVLQTVILVERQCVWSCQRKSYRSKQEIFRQSTVHNFGHLLFFLYPCRVLVDSPNCYLSSYTALFIWQPWGHIQHRSNLRVALHTWIWYKTNYVIYIYIVYCIHVGLTCTFL